MDDPILAAKALREHLRQSGISEETFEPSDIQKSEADLSQKTTPESLKSLIHVFNKTEFTPTPGVEASLSLHVAKLSAEGLANEKTVCILQFDGELTMSNVIELLESGVKVYEPLGRSAILVRLSASSLSLIESLPYIRWVGEYKPEYKYSSGPFDPMKHAAFVYTFGGDRPEYRDELNQLGITIIGYDSIAQLYNVVLDADKFKQLAEGLWWVRGITKEPVAITNGFNFEPDDSREIISAFRTSFSGFGVNVGVLDTGIYFGNSLDFPSGSIHSLGGVGDSGGHGTHVSGIIASRGGRPLEGLHNSQGVASNSNIYMVSGIGSTSAHYSYPQAFQYFSDNGAQVSNHSWGYTVLGGNPDTSYNSNTADMDAYADNDDSIIVFSAGNASSDGAFRKIGNPGTAKNVITVGALNYVTIGSEVLGRRAAYSSLGPTNDDSRLKPDIAAPGGNSENGFDQGIVSTSSNPWNLPPYSGNINGIYEYFEWPTDDHYLRLSGTSQAAPHVAGVLALMKEWAPNLSPELIKAKLINDTIAIKENSSDALAGYANVQVGYGMVDAFSATHFFIGESEKLVFGDGTVTEDNRINEWTVTVADGTKQLKVTLAYNDQEGESSNAFALKDDLDLILLAPDGTQYNAYQHKAPGVSTESPLEKMVIVNPISGTWTIRVNFADSPGFGNPFLFATQRFGVVAEAFFKTPSLTLSVPQTTINAIPTQNLTIQPTIANTGGGMAAGITLRVDGNAAFGAGLNATTYVGNLLSQNSSVSPAVHLTAPSVLGSYTFTIRADGINKEFDNASYPRIVQITVNVVSPIDTDHDGMPDTVEVAEGTNSGVKDNAIFTNARLFAMQQYRDFLGREGDPGGITFWTNLINSGSLTRAQVIDSFFNSPEFQGTVSPVTRLYFAYFLRIPDYGGLNFWVNQYHQGATLDSISQAFAASPEFQATYGSLSNTQFVTLVYQNVLGRAPDPGGLAFWVGQLNSGAMTRGQVMLGFSESAEYKQSSFNKVYVTMIYVGMLRRAPEQGGFDFWVNALNSGASGLNLIQGFLNAPEYRSRFLP